MKATQSCLTPATPWTVIRQAPSSMGFSRQESWSGCYFFLQEIFLTQELNPSLLHCRQVLYRLRYEESPNLVLTMHKTLFSGCTFHKPFYYFLYQLLCSPILKQPPVNQTYFLFPHKMQFHSSYLLCWKLHILLSLSNEELMFILAFYRLVSINTSDNF